MHNDDTLYVITGPTASGKTSKAVALAKAIDAEIISADSRQIYRGMDLGTGKDLEEYDGVPYHLSDMCEAGYKYNLFEYLRDYQAARDDIRSRGKRVILCGGTGLYVESVLKGIELPPVPEDKALRASLEGKSLDELTEILRGYKTLHNTTDVDSCKRAIRAIEIGKYYHEHPDLEMRTTPHPVENAVVIGVEIELSYEEMFTQLEIAIHQFAKRQMTWFRGMERRGYPLHWLDWRLSNEEFVAAVKVL